MTVIIVLIGAFCLGFICQTVWSRFLYKETHQAIRQYSPINIGKLFHKVLGFYLLLRIGIVGGAEIMGETWSKIAIPILLAIVLSIFMALATLLILARFSSLEFETRISLAVHYGSVSMGTFAAVLALLQALGIHYASYVTAWVAIMEFPAIVVGVLALGQGAQAIVRLLRQDASMLTLPIALCLGALLGEHNLHKYFFNLVFDKGFEPLLTVYLFEMGRVAGENLKNLSGQPWRLISIGILIPVFGGTFAAATGRLAGIGLGETTILAALTASASYVAAPAVMSSAIASIGKGGAWLAQRAVSVSLATSVGITLPFNILLGLRLYLFLARGFENRHIAFFVVVLVLAGMLLILLWDRLQHLLSRIALSSLHVEFISAQGLLGSYRLGEEFFYSIPLCVETVRLESIDFISHLDSRSLTKFGIGRSNLNSREPP